MGQVVFNISRMKQSYYATLPAANDGIIAVLLKAAGLEADGTLQDYANLQTLLAASNDEADFTGYSRQVLTTVTSTVDNTNNRVDINADDPAWSPTTAQALGKIIFCYDPDTTTGTDADLIPLFADDYVLTTPLTGQISYQIAASGFLRGS